MHVALLGLGEAGRRYADDLLAAGRRVTGYDPGPVSTPDGVERAQTAAEAVNGARLVASFTGASVAVRAAADAGPGLAAGTCFADFNSAAPATKRAVAEALAGRADAADVAVLAPVPRAGAATPLAASGAGAGTVAEVFRPLGAQVDVLSEPVGAAAGRKLLRSVFMKGLAATVIEAVTAGEAAGCADWIRAQIGDELGPQGPALVDRLIDGTRLHAGRRVHEMEAAAEYLDELGAETPICTATLEWLNALSK